MEDITPKLIREVTEDFHRRYAGSGKVKDLLEKVKAGTATYAEAQEYSLEVSRLIGQAYQAHVSGAALPDGRMYYNIASRLVPATVDENHALVADYAASVQKTLNEKAGIGLQVQKAPVDADRVDGLVELACSDEYEAVEQQLLSAFETYDQAVVDETIRRNADLHYGAGLSPKIIRRSTGKCCAWCREKAGVHRYPVEREIYRRHGNCRCTVLYDPADGRKKVQNVHSKKWTSDADRAKIKTRQQIGQLSESGRRYLPDIEIGRSVGAKAMNYDVMDLETGELFKFAEGSRIQNVEVFAGKGTKKELKIAQKYADRHGGSAADWQHVKGHGVVDTPEGYRNAEVHWMQCAGVGKFDFFVKRWEDE